MTGREHGAHGVEHRGGQRSQTPHGAGRTSLRILQVIGALLLVAGSAAALAFSGTAGAGTGVGVSGNTITDAAQAQAPFTATTPFDSGQPINVVVPANSVLNPGASIFILECAAPNGVNPTTINSCDGNTAYAGGTISVDGDGSIDVVNTSTNSGIPYKVYALPDHVSLGESPSGSPKCGLGAANECVLYIGQGGGSDIGLSAPHYFSQPFQVHTDPTDSGTLNPGDGSPQPVTSVSPTLSTVQPATQSVTADGLDPATVTVTLDDGNSVGVPGKTVTLAAQGGHSTIVPASGAVTDASGHATFTVTDSTAEAVTYSATDSTDAIHVTQAGQVTFAPQSINQTVSAATASPASVPADGSTQSTITVSLRDRSVHGSPAPIVGHTVQLAAATGSSVIVPSSAGSDVTDASGLATFSVTDAVSQTVTYRATVDGVTLTSTASVTFGAPLTVSASASTITASPSPALTGSAGTAVTVTLVASNGTSPISGKVVTLSFNSPSGTASITGGDTAVSDGSGKAAFAVTDNMAESVTFSATDTTDGVNLDAKTVVAFDTPPPPTVSPTASTVTISGSPAPADGFTEAIVNVTVINTASSPVSGVAVTVTASPNKNVLVDAVGGSNLTNSQGGVQFGVRGTIAEMLTFTVSVGKVTLTSHPTAIFTAGSADANQSTVSASPVNVAANGTSASSVSITLTDYFGNPVAGKAITLAPSAGSSVSVPIQVTAGVSPGITDSKGVARFSVTDAKTEVVTYSATDSADGLLLSQLASVTFGTPPPVLPVKADSTVVANAVKSPADGKTVVTVTVELRDANGRPVTGKKVSLSPSGGSSVITAATAKSGSIADSPSAPSLRPAVTPAAATVVTNSNGNALFDISNTVAESVTYTGTDITDSVSGWTVAVVFTAATASTTTTTTAPAVTTTTTSPSTSASSGSTGSSSTDASGTGSSGAAASAAATDSSSAPNLAFTGAPAALPWIFGLGAAFLLLGTVGRRALIIRRRDR